MTTSIFDQPYSQRNTLLQQRSWADLCEIDFPNALASGLLERLTIIIDHIISHPPCNLSNCGYDLSHGINEHVFLSSKWDNFKINHFLMVLLDANYKMKSDKHDVLAPLISAIVQSSPPDFSIPSDSRLYLFSVSQDNDLLSQLLNRTPEQQHTDVLEFLLADAQGVIDFSTFPLQTNTVLFTKSTVQVMPKLVDQIIKYKCDGLRWDLNLGLSIKERVTKKFNNLLSPPLFRDDNYGDDAKILIAQKEIEVFDRFVDVHSSAFTVQHWNVLLTLFKKIEKQHDVGCAPVLRSYGLHSRLNTVVNLNHPTTQKSMAPPKRKM